MLLVYDVVTAHYPELFPPFFVSHVQRVFFRNTHAATLVGCMTRYIRQQDLVGILQVNPDRVRVVYTVSPLPTDVGDLPAAVRDLRRPYLVYPTMFRPYKNIDKLLKAMALLIFERGLDTLDLVFTDPGCPEVHRECQSFIEELGLQDHVHILGSVPRPQVTALYRGALGAVVTSSYEGIGLQVHEALASGCPVICSDIPVFREQCQAFGQAMIYFDPQDPAAIAGAIEHLYRNREAIRERQRQAFSLIPTRGWQTVAREWLVHLREAAQDVPEPAAPSQPAPRSPEVFIFLPIAFPGGVWQAARNLLTALVDVNRRRGHPLRLRFAFPAGQVGLETLGPGLEAEQLLLTVHSPHEILSLPVNHQHSWLLDDLAKGRDHALISNVNALRADAWFSLSDKFPAPLLADRPYGVLVHDMIQRHVPEAFEACFFQVLKTAILPTLRRAQLLVTTNPVTQQDLCSELELGKEAVKIAPLGYDVRSRFATIVPQPVPLPRRPFIFNLNNISPHKGAAVMLRGYHRLRESMEGDAPLLVMCGPHTETFSPTYRGPVDHPFARANRDLVQSLDLREGRDVVFLGHVSDGQLLTLLQESAVIVNTAKYDSGSYNLLEGHFFGRPVVSTRYSAAEWLYQRFQVPVRYFPVGDVESMVEQIRQALAEGPAGPDRLQEIRRGLSRPEILIGAQAEHLLDHLLALACQGQQARGNIHNEAIKVPLPCHRAA